MINNSIHFIFDSGHIDAIQTRLYGFYTTESGMFTQAPSEGGDIVDVTGPWVLVRRSPAGIEITQDSVGCFGLFLFRKGDYWALSNSFNHLLDYLKTGFDLSLNRDYATALLAQELCVSVYGETIINEISWLDRRARLHIDTQTAELSFSLRCLGEKTVPIDSKEGLLTLDTWHDKWASLVRGAVESWPERIVVDVSGGFDTRMMLAPVLSAGVDLASIVFCSIPTLEEDYRIANYLAQEFGFRLNTESEPTTVHPLPFIEPYAERAVSTLFFESRIREQSSQLPNSWQMVFKGSGGELSRSYWEDINCSTFIERNLKRLQEVHSQPRDDRFRQRLESIISRSFTSVEMVLKQTEGCIGKTGINGQQYYMETRNRSHFGMEAARRTLFGQFIQTPLLDPLLLKLRTPLDGSHPMLISALVYTRYHERLSSFPFDRGRCIPEETLQMARELNERYPGKKSARSTAHRIATTWQAIDVPSPRLSGDSSDTNEMLMSDRLIEAYESPTVWRNFAEEFGTTPDEWRESNPAKRRLNGDKYAAVSIAKVLDDIKHGKDACKDYAAFVEACRQEVASICDSAGLTPDVGNDWNTRIRKQILLQTTRSGLLFGASDSAKGYCRSPKISVVIPVCDDEACMRRCVENLLEQTMHDLEFIFVDDCSSDGARAVAGFWAANDARVHIIRDRERSDAVYSLNRGIEEARGEYLAFVDPRDYVSPHFFKLLYAAAVSDGGHDIAKGLGLRTTASGWANHSPGSRLNDKIRWNVTHERPLYRAFTTDLHTAIFRRGLVDSEESAPLILRLCRHTNDIVIVESAHYTYAQARGDAEAGRFAGETSSHPDALSGAIALFKGDKPDKWALDYLCSRAEESLQWYRDRFTCQNISRDDYECVRERISRMMGELPGLEQAAAKILK